MDEDEQTDIDDAALAHQQELESEQWQEWLRSDPAYEQWLNTYNDRSEQNEISSES